MLPSAEAVKRKSALSGQSQVAAELDGVARAVALRNTRDVSCSLGDDPPE